MAVITRYIVVRDGVELDRVFADKKEAEAYDKLLDAAQSLVALIGQGNLQIDIAPKTIEEIAIYLANNAQDVINILKNVKPVKSGLKDEAKVKSQPETAEDKKRAPETKAKSKGKA